MDIAIVSTVISGLTAIAALVAPAISAYITVKATERSKKFELYAPQAYGAVRKLTEAYSQFPRQSDYFKVSEYQKENLHFNYTKGYQAFSAAAYEVMSLICAPDIHNLLINLLKDMEGKHYTGELQDRAFQDISEALALELAQISGAINRDNKDRQ